MTKIASFSKKQNAAQEARSIAAARRPSRDLVAWQKQLRDELAGMGFDDPEMAVDGGDAVEYLGKLYDDLEQMIGSPQ